MSNWPSGVPGGRERRSLAVILAAIAVGLCALLLLINSAPKESQAVSPILQHGVLDFAYEGLGTSLTFGPDGRLYVASTYHVGADPLWRIDAVTLDPEGQRSLGTEKIADGLSFVLGLAFDPTVPPSPVTLYATREEPTDTPSYQGRVTTFSAPGWLPSDIITGLPRWRVFQHQTNGIAFDEAGRLFIAQGSMSNAGVGYEAPLAGAILEADINDPAFDGHVTYDPPGEPMSNDINQVSGDVRVFASGLRNPYDLVVHSNSRIYASDNGAAGGLTSTSCETAGFVSSAFDELNLIEEGHYYGQPNRNRGRFSSEECVYHLPTEPSNGGYTAPIAVISGGSNCNGLAEYTGVAFQGMVPGDLLCVGIDGQLRWIHLSDDGREAVHSSLLATGLERPLDVAVGPDGTIYVSSFNKIDYFVPEAVPPTATPEFVATPTAAPPTTLPSATPTASATLSPTTTPATPLGDVDCDGTTNSIDAALILQYVASLINSLPGLANGDVNDNGTVDAIDAALVLQCNAGLVNCATI